MLGPPGNCGLLVEVDAEAGHVRGERVAVLPADLLREQVYVEGPRPLRHLLHADVRRRHAEGDARGGADRAQRVMRNDVDIVSLAPVGHLQRLGQPAHDAQVDAGVADQLLLYDLAEGPFARPLLAGGYGQGYVLRQGAVAARVLRPERVLDEEGLVRLQGLAQADDVRRVQARVDIEEQLDIRPDGVPHGGHLRLAQPDSLDRLQRARPSERAGAGGASLREAPARELPALLLGGQAALDEREGISALVVRVADDLVPHRPAQELVDRHAEGLALDVPERDVDGADRRAVGRVGGEEGAPEHVLPQALSRERVLADDDLGEVLQGGVDGRAPEGHADLAEAVYPLVGLHLDDVIAAAVLAQKRKALDGGDFHGGPPMNAAYRLLDRTYYSDSGRLEVTDVAGNHGQAVLQRRGGDEQVCPVVPNGSRQLPPPSCGGGIYRKNAVAVPGQHPV